MTRLERLQQSLIKKEAVLDSKIDSHFGAVKQANGQPINDKRNGASTLKAWQKQENSIKKQLAEVQKTQNAIEHESWIDIECKAVLKEMPTSIQNLVENGQITQWRKYPNRFFVKGIQKARIVVDLKTGKISHSYLNQISQDEQTKFLEIFNSL